MGEKIPEKLKAKVQEWVNPKFPLGPTDAADIDDPEVAALLFDPHNISFNSLLRTENSVVVGRRGSGKTALLNSYLYRPYLNKSEMEEPSCKSPGFDFTKYDFVLTISSHQQFEIMLGRAADINGNLRPIESVIDDWLQLFCDFVLTNLIAKFHDPTTSEPNISIIQSYLSAPEVSERIEAEEAVWGPNTWNAIKNLFCNNSTNAEFPTCEAAMQAMERYLLSQNKQVIVIFDSLDEYEMGNAKNDRAIGALLRAIPKFNRKNKQIKLKVGLPSEIFPEIQRASGNPNKDLSRFDPVRWTSIELLQIAAYRYRLFLQLYDEAGYHSVSHINLSHRKGAREFWLKLFDEDVLNYYNNRESPLIYLLRHTQLLPRQLLMMLEKAIIESHAKTGGYRLIQAKAVSLAVNDMEGTITGEIFAAYKYVYPFAEMLGKALFGNFSTVFDFNELEHRWRQFGRSFMWGKDQNFEVVHCLEMLLRMGVIGLVNEDAQKDLNKPGLYIEAEFAYPALMPINVGMGNWLCIHPLFSKYLGCSGNTAEKAILPKGVAIGEEP